MRATLLIVLLVSVGGNERRAVALLMLQCCGAGAIVVRVTGLCRPGAPQQPRQLSTILPFLVAA
jgi:hypothetical protein